MEDGEPEEGAQLPLGRSRVPPHARLVCTFPGSSQNMGPRALCPPRGFAVTTLVRGTSPGRAASAPSLCTSRAPRELFNEATWLGSQKGTPNPVAGVRWGG